MILISRKEAIEKGLKRYFTGKECKYGHVSERYTSSFQCFACSQQDEYKEKKRAITKAWISANPERAAENDRRKYQARKDEIKERIDLWRRSNLDRANLSRRIRKHRVRAAGPMPGIEVIAGMLSMQRGRCANCLVDISACYQIDHIHPVSKGGTNHRSNLQLLCGSCNARKSAKDPMRWAAENGRLL